jgi:hypothetical protein
MRRARSRRPSGQLQVTLAAFLPSIQAYLVLYSVLRRGQRNNRKCRLRLHHVSFSTGDCCHLELNFPAAARCLGSSDKSDLFARSDNKATWRHGSFASLGEMTEMRRNLVTQVTQVTQRLFAGFGKMRLSAVSLFAGEAFLWLGLRGKIGDLIGGKLKAFPYLHFKSRNGRGSTWQEPRRAKMPTPWPCLLAANLTPIAIKMLPQRSAAQRSASPRNHQLSQQASSVPCGDILLKSQVSLI